MTVADIEVPARPVLSTIPNVELIKVGRWEISTGVWNVTSADLYAAVSALSSPAVRNPVIKLGHLDPRFNAESEDARFNALGVFDGTPAVGWIGNLRVSDNGSTLVGDYCGVPSWLADVLASAYPDRSIEGAYDFRDQTGRTHQFVLTAVSLLGVTPPGVGTLSSLQDVAALYGVAASGDTSGQAFHVPVTKEGTPMPNATAVSAGQTVDDIMRSFYDGPAADNWWWIEEIYVDPTELVAVDDETGTLYKVPFTATDTGLTWGEPVEVKREYVAASAKPPVASWSSREQSRPGLPNRPAAAAGDPNQEGTSMLTFDDTQAAELLSLLGLADGAEPADVLDAVKALASSAEGTGDTSSATSASSATPEPEAVRAAAAGLGLTVLDAGTVEELRRNSAEGVAARAELKRQDLERRVGAAVAAGKIPPSRRDHWLTALENDEGMADVLASMPDNLVPVSETGHNGDAVGASVETDAEDLNWFGGK